MKKVVKGKMYNTDTAVYLGTYWYLFYNDLAYEKEDLYRKKNGEFFLIAEGGPASRYARTEGSTMYATYDNVILLTENEARKWVEKNLDADMYIRLFGLPEE